MRKVTVISTKTNQPTVIDTDITTWGDLSTLLTEKGLYNTDMKAMERASRATYEHPGAALPAGDFALFLTPGKMKSGK
jgi:hypothetical protein